jgi:hypothetical protein
MKDSLIIPRQMAKNSLSLWRGATMDETTRRLQIGVEMMTWIVAMPDLLKRLGKAETMPSLSDSEKQNLREIAKRLTALFQKAGEMADADQSNKEFYKQLIAHTDRLREAIVEANVILDRLKVPD